MHKKINDGFLGLAIGDALGVPVEFKKREFLKGNPVTEMLGYMCWNQAPGTWSDDSSLAFCLAESLKKGYDLKNIAELMLKWKNHGYWGAHNEVFDIGGSTNYSLKRLESGESPFHSGNFFEKDNGNGSLMRILPLSFYLSKEENLREIYSKVKEVSSITHAHFRSVFSCFIYTVFVLELLKQEEKFQAYENTKNLVLKFAVSNEFNPVELNLFSRILVGQIYQLHEDEINSSGYVLDTLEASLWCVLNSDNYSDSVLKAVNLGGDTDTTACVTGGLAGIIFGLNATHTNWINAIARKEDILQLIEEFNESLIKNKKI